MRFRDFVGGIFLGLISTSSAQSKPDHLAIPITLAQDNYAHLSVRVNSGTPLDFIFDTGASICVLTEQGRRKMGELKFDSSQKTLGSGGETRQPIASAVKLSLGNQDWANQTLMFIDYHGSLHADGVIGYNLFSHKTIQLDYDQATLNVYDQPPEYLTSGTPVMVTMKDDLAFIPVTLSSGTTTHSDLFAVDTGDGGTMTVAGGFAKRAQLPGNLETLGNGKSGGTGNGIVEIKAVKLPLVSLGELSTENVPAEIHLTQPKDFKTWNILGNEIIRRLNLVWDIDGKKMYLSRSKHFSDPYKLPGNKRPPFIVLLGTAILIGGGLFFAHRKYKRNRK